jgi:hypothetical protein
MGGSNLPGDKEELSTGSDSDTDSYSTVSSSSDSDDEDCRVPTNEVWCWQCGCHGHSGMHCPQPNDMMETEDGAEVNVDSLQSTSDNHNTGPAATSIRTPAEEAGGTDTPLVASGPLPPLNTGYLSLEEQCSGGPTLPSAGPSCANHPNAPVIAEPRTTTARV